MMFTTNPIRLLGLSVLIVVLSMGFSHASQEAAGPTATVLDDIKVSFKVDPRVTRSTYTGDQWISPTTYIRVGEGKTVIVEVKAFGLDVSKQEITIEPQWKSSDSNVVQVSPAQGHQVEITILKAGHSELTVTHGKISKKLVVKATPLDRTLRVEISKKGYRSL